MGDVHTAEVRSRNMAAIRAKDTQPELALRRALHAAGFRYRLHVTSLPGRPDIVLPKYRAVVMVHGCFFHGHDCRTFRWPATRKDFWRRKIQGNRDRDYTVDQALRRSGWRVITVWECALRGKRSTRLLRLASITAWLRGNEEHADVSGPSDADN
jgi:DNA mismatch endonuclease (patch repair protein)